MFQCAAGHLTEAGQKQYKLITHKRQKEYSVRFTTTGKHLPGGQGWEIAKEVNVCEKHRENTVLIEHIKIKKPSHREKVEARKDAQRLVRSTLELS